MGDNTTTELPFPALIAKKRDGQELTKDEIRQFVTCVTNKSMQESQIGAMLMAIFLRGMTPAETAVLTESMMRSGEVLSWPEDWRGQMVDKHSTGGVGDKISLPLAPALAACGAKVPMISGRGLEHTGGTLDKLESIPGYTVTQSADSMRRILAAVGCCIVGQTESLVPADKKLYAIRDVTSTVANTPLISGSIISKKGAEGLDALILDVKVGSGAVMKTKETARQLAQSMVNVGNVLGMKVTALLTKMEQPIGRMVGNSLEIIETMECLQGRGPRDTMELTEQEGGYCLYNLGKVDSPQAGAERIHAALTDGTALEKFRLMLIEQGVAESVAGGLCSARGEDFYKYLKPADHKTEICVESTGYVENIDAMDCALVSFGLGAGRTRADKPVDHAVGLEIHVASGDSVQQGDAWVTIHHNRDVAQKEIDHLKGALIISTTPPEHLDHSLIIEVIN